MTPTLNESSALLHFLCIIPVIGVNVSEPNTSESNWDFSYIIFWRIYVVLYIFNAAIGVGCMRM